MNIDFDPATLGPGDSLSTPDCEKILGIKSSNFEKFQLGLLQLSNFIERGLGKRYTITTRDRGVQVLTHAEAADYNATRFDAGRALMRRANRRAMRVDAGQLSDAERHRHNETLAKQARMLIAIGSRQPLDTPVVVASSEAARKV